jgi:hypothetical protein
MNSEIKIKGQFKKDQILRILSHNEEKLNENVIASYKVK